MKKKISLTLLGAALALPFIAAPAFGLSKFRHYQHVGGQGLSCFSCHQVEGNTYTLPDHTVCNSCHRKELAAETVTGDSCGTCHVLVKKNGDKNVVIENRPSKPTSSFVHTKKLGDICYTCHHAMLEEVVAQGMIRDQAELRRIRMISHRFHFREECRDCHNDNRSSQQKPDSHKTDNWRSKAHMNTAPYFNCRLCHKKSFCQNCHESIY